MGAELHLLQEDRRKYLNNLIICYWNIKGVRNKIADFQIIIQSLPLDYVVLSETKLDKYGPEEIEIKIVVVLLNLLKRGIICNRISDFELSFLE